MGGRFELNELARMSRWGHYPVGTPWTHSEVKVFNAPSSQPVPEERIFGEIRPRGEPT